MTISDSVVLLSHRLSCKPSLISQSSRCWRDPRRQRQNLATQSTPFFSMCLLSIAMGIHKILPLWLMLVTLRVVGACRHDPSSAPVSSNRVRTMAKALTMRGGTRKDDGPYSFSLTTFSPQGSLGQIEYALNAVSDGALTVAVTYDAGVAMASLCKAKSSLVMDMGRSKIAQVADSVAMLHAGLSADSRLLEKRSQEYYLGWRRKFGDDTILSIGALVSDVALAMQEYTQMSGVRPFGVALLIAGVEGVDAHPETASGTCPDAELEAGQCVPRLFKVEPSGRYSAWKAAAIGKGSAEAEGILRSEYRETMSRNHAVRLALSAILRSTAKDVRQEDVEIAFVEGGNVQHLQVMDLR